MEIDEINDSYERRTQISRNWDSNLSYHLFYLRGNLCYHREFRTTGFFSVGITKVLEKGTSLVYAVGIEWDSEQTAKS
jgi:hypothetical protein